MHLKYKSGIRLISFYLILKFKNIVNPLNIYNSLFALNIALSRFQKMFQTVNIRITLFHVMIININEVNVIDCLN